MLPSNTFGIEVECYLPEGGSPAACAAAVSARLGSTGACYAEHRNAIDRPHWKIITDGSLGDLVRGIEAVSPVLSGEAGLAQVKAVMDALSDYGCTVSRKCGLHVHVGARDAEITFFRRLFKLYAAYEPIIDSFMPPSRRQSSNTYCRSMTSVSFAAVDRAADVSGLLNLLTTMRNFQRYYKLNLAAYSKHRTVEFRQHSGTLEYNKAANWIGFCLRMVEAAKSEQAAPSTSAAPVNRAKPGSKTHIVGELLLRPEGVSYREALAATGWRQLSLPPIIAACGLNFTTQRTGREVRFFAQAAEASSEVRPTLDNLFRRLNCEPEEQEYFRARVSNLRGAVQWAA